MGTSSMVLARTSVTSSSCFTQVVSKVKAAWNSTRGSVVAHPYRTLGIVGGVSLLGYILYLYRTGELSCNDVRAFFAKFCPCTKKVDSVKK
jgi:hypothetical protein